MRGESRPAKGWASKGVSHRLVQLRARYLTSCTNLLCTQLDYLHRRSLRNLGIPPLVRIAIRVRLSPTSRRRCVHARRLRRPGCIHRASRAIAIGVARPRSRLGQWSTICYSSVATSPRYGEPARAGKSSAITRHRLRRRQPSKVVCVGAMRRRCLPMPSSAAAAAAAAADSTRLGRRSRLVIDIGQ